MTMSQNFRVQTLFAKNGPKKGVRFAGCKHGCKPLPTWGFALKVNEYRGFRGVQTWVQTSLQTFDAKCKHANPVNKDRVAVGIGKNCTFWGLYTYE